ncbi:MAG: transcriptional repressor LexA [Opitutaceae bacterium]|nr:transcriptional repressor LexA [Opitutaceae bacterium]
MLTEKQQAVLDHLRLVQTERGIPPSTREIQRHFGFASPNSALNHLRALARKGYIEQLDGRTWGLRAKEVQGHLFDVPLFGSIPAGLPTEQEQQAEESVFIDPVFFGLASGDRRRLWALRVSGDSMVGAHICNGDIAILERRTPRAGEIIAALVDETTTTLKRLVYQQDRPLLHAENPRYPDIAPDRLECQGVLVGVIRKIKEED